MTTLQRIRDLAEEKARREIEERIVGCAQHSLTKLYGDEGEIIVAKGELLTTEVLRRIPDIDTFERLIIADFGTQDEVFRAIDRYHEVVPHHTQGLKDWVTRLLRENDSTITSITINRRKSARR